MKYGGATAIALLLAACATHHAPVADDAAVRRYASQGYAAAGKSSVTASTQDWLIEGNRLQVVMALPAGTKPLPLVIYLPGMGEAASPAGRRAGSATPVNCGASDQRSV